MIFVEDNKSPAEWLVHWGNIDIRDRSEWQEDVEFVHRMRMGARKRSTAYPGAPNWCDPIIDDMVNRITAMEFQIMKQPRYYANFIPLDAQSQAFKEKVEIGFDNLLNMFVDFDKTLERLLDAKNEMGMAIGKIVVNDTAYRRVYGADGILPEIVSRHPIDVVVPVGTEEIGDSERIIDIFRYTPNSFIREAQKRGWNADHEFLGSLQTVLNGRQNQADTSGRTRYIGLQETPDSMEYVVVWECYYFDDDGKRKFMVFSPDFPDHILKEHDWMWMDGSERRWPYEQIRFENRIGDFYDVRGAGHMLKDHQRASSQFMNIKGMAYDFYAKPYLETTEVATGTLQTFHWRPGDSLPKGLRFAQPPKIDPQFNFDADLERQRAERRVGSMQSSMQSGGSRDRVTATEVNRQAVNTQVLSTNAVQRFTRSVGIMFQMMYEWLRQNPAPPLPIVDKTGELEFIGQEIYGLPYLVKSSATARNHDPIMKLNQMISIGSFLQNNPTVKPDRWAKFLTNQIDPYLSDDMITDLQQESPISEEIGNIKQAVLQMNEQVKSHQQVFEAMDDDLSKEENEISA